MRLLDVRTLEIIEFSDKNVPPYAILSHTWDEDEMSFQDMKRHRRERKKGYVKIKQCCKRAVKDGLDYVWVDTCCIDKRSSAELSEAINSMFRWYRGAAICYAYLSDIPGDSSDIQKPFTESRWFTRGWTLQELLAPRRVDFFTAHWEKFGDREELRSHISAITQIHESALLGRVEAIRGFSIAQKMSWAARRVTTRVEDIAYCLIGIFNINMPLLYGEGEKAFIRLQEEIMKDYDDQSLFAWQGRISEIIHSSAAGFHGTTVKTKSGDPDNHWHRNGRGPMSLLASSPSSFKLCSRIVPFRDWEISEPYSMTNAGLRITGLLGSFSGGIRDQVLFIRCYDEEAPDHWLGIFLTKLSPKGDQFARTDETICRHSGPLFEQTETKTIFIRKEIIMPDPVHVLQIGKRLSFHLVFLPTSGYNFNVTGAWPLNQGPDSTHIRPPSGSSVLISPSNWSWYAAVGFELDCKEKEASASFVLLVGYDGRNDRCWTDLKLKSNSPGRADDEEAKSAFDKVGKGGIDTRWCSTTLQCWLPAYKWVIEIHVVDSIGEEIANGDELSERWDGNPMQVRIDVVDCLYMPEGPVHRSRIL